MLDIIRYVQNKTATFEQEDFCEVDSIVFSWLSYLVLPEEIAQRTHHGGVPVKDVYKLEYFANLFSRVQMPDDTEWLFSLVAASPRYRDIIIKYYEDQIDTEIDKQFSALCFMLPNKRIVVAFRGTDQRFTGWKEDLRLSLDRPVPAQIEAHKYLNKVGFHYPDHKIIVAGHSKGGNLAVYSAARCLRHIQDRILSIYSLDGPGFPSSALINDGFRLIYTRCRKLVPESSFVGLMMDDDLEFDIVQSFEKGFNQHFPLTWCIEGDQVVRMDKLRTEARILERGLDNWVQDMSLEQRRKFIDTIFEILEETGAEDFTTLGENLKSYLPAIFKKLESMERKDRLFLLNAFKNLAESEVKSIPSVLKDMH